MIPVSLVTGCDRDGSNQITEGLLRVGNGGEPKSLDPHIVTGVIEERILSALFEGLVNMDFSTLEPLPGVAERWDVSDDGTVYTFHLRDGARWSNGDPVTAHDFAYSWRRVLEPGLAAEYAYMLYPILNAEAYNNGGVTDFEEVGVKALDDRTLEVTLRAPTPYFLALHVHFTFYPVHRATIERHGSLTDRNSPWTRPGNLVGNGPFQLTHWRPNDRIAVEPNAHYWDADAVGLERIEYFPISDPSVEERLFRAGSIDVTYSLPIPKIRRYRDENPDTFRTDPYIATEFIRFNTTHGPFDDPRVRRALALAIDRGALVENVILGGQRPAETFVPPQLYANPPGKDYRLIYNPSRARELLAEAGYPGGEGFPPAEMMFDPGDLQRRIVETVQHMWQQELGIEIALVNKDTKTWLADMIALNYDIARSYWVGDYPDPSNFLEMFYAGSGNNRTGFDSPEYEALLREAAFTRDTAARDALYQQAEQRLLDQAVIAPIYYYTRTYLVRPELHGLTPNVLGRVPWKNVRWKNQN